LVDLMGGSITVESELGRGSIFAVTFLLPLAAWSESAAQGAEAGRSFTEV